MKFELNLLELNELYYLTSKSVESKTEDLKTRKEPDTMNYFVRELSKTKKLRDKLSTYLVEYVNELEKNIPNHIDEEIE